MTTERQTISPPHVGFIGGARLSLAALRPHWVKSILAIVLITFGIVLEAAALVSLAPLIGALGADTGGDTGVFGAMESVYGSFSIPYTSTSIILGIVVLFGVKAIITTAGELFRSSVWTDIERDFRDDLVDGLVSARWSSVTRYRSGDLINVLLQQAGSGASAAGQFLSVIALLTTVMVYVTFAMLVSFTATLAVMSIIIVAGFATTYLFRAMTRLASQVVGISAAMAQKVTEFINGFVVIKSMNAESGAREAMREETNHMKRVMMRTQLIQSVFGSALEPAIILGLLCVLALQALTDLDVASAGVIGLLLLRNFQRIYGASVAIGQLGTGMPSLAIVESLQKQLDAEQEHDGGRPTGPFSSLEFRDVSFRYNSSTPVLQGINLTVTKGEFVGIVGASGSGKSTLSALVAGLLVPDEGVVLLNGVPLPEVDRQSWRRSIGYVPQEGHLFTQSISENILMWRENLSEDDIKRATSIAQAEQFITRLADGYNAPVHDRGSNFSGGERQRLALARALASEPELLLLDEATSALDSQSEKDFHDALTGLRGNHTIIAIAHRLSTVLDADTVIVLEEGRVLEEGPPQELLSIPDGHFRRYYDIQVTGSTSK